MANETTTKFKVDVSDLKKGIQEASRQIKLANAEFKAAASGMDNWGKSADGVSKKVSQLEKVLESQKKILENYEKQLELIAKEYGENSKEADEMRIRIANQQAVVNGTTKELEKYQGILEDLRKEEEKAADGAKDQAKAYDQLRDSAEEQQKQLEALKNEYKQVVIEQGKDSESARELAKEIEDLSGELADSKKAMSDAEKAADDLDKSLEDVDPENVANGFTVLKGALAELVAQGISKAIEAIKDFAREVISVGKEFDGSMSQVSAISGATGDELGKLRDKAKEMGETTAFSASEAADAFTYMAMAGWKTEDMIEGIDGIMSLAAASGTDLATTSDIVTDALTGMGYEAKDAAKLADVMAAASSNANTNVELMGETFKYVAPLVGAMGYSMEDTAVAVGLMANAGIKGSQAGTALRGALTKIVKPSKEAQGALIQLGLVTQEYEKVVDAEKVATQQSKLEKAIASMEKAQIKYNDAVKKNGASSSQAKTALINLEQAQKNAAAAQEALTAAQEGELKVTSEQNLLLTDENGNMRSLGEVLGVLRESFKDLTEEEQAQVAASLFGQEAMSGMLAVINATESDVNKLTTAVNESSGAAQKMADTMLDNLGGDMTLLSSKIEGVQLALYEKFEPAMRKGVEVLSKLTDAVGWVVDHSDAIVTTLTSMGAAIGAYVAYGTAIKIMQNGFASLAIVQKAVTAAQWLMNAAMEANPIGLVAAAIAGLVAAFVVLWKKSEAFRKFWISLWSGIKSAASGAWEGIQKAAKGAWNFVTKTWEGVVKFFSGAWEGIKMLFRSAAQWINDNVFVPVMSFFQPVIDFFTTAFEIIGQLSEGCWNLVQMAWSGAAEWFDANVTKPVTGFFKDAWNAVSGAAKSAWETVTRAWTVAKTWFTQNVTEPISKFFSDAWNKLTGGAEKAWEGIKGAFAPVAEWFEGVFSKAWEAVRNVFSVGGKIFDGIKEGIGDAFKAVVNTLIRGINTVVSIPFNAINKALETISKVKILGAEPFKDLISRFDVPQIPYLQTGGVLKKGQVGLLEGSGAEAVVPLERNKKWIAATAKELRKTMAREGFATGISGTQQAQQGATYNFIQNNSSPKALDRLEIYRQTRNQIELAKGVI